MSDRESGDEQSQVAQRGLHCFACHCFQADNGLFVALRDAPLHCCRKSTPRLSPGVLLTVLHLVLIFSLCSTGIVSLKLFYDTA